MGTHPACAFKSMGSFGQIGVIRAILADSIAIPMRVLAMFRLLGAKRR